MLHSNNCVAIHLTDISAAENYYTNVMKFEMVSRTETSVAYDAGAFLLKGERGSGSGAADSQLSGERYSGG